MQKREIDNYQVIDKSVVLGERLRADIISRHKAAGQLTTGKTSGMLTVERTAVGFRLVGWKYSGVWEEGRQPNKKPWGTSHSASHEWSDSLINWARAKGITFKTPADAQNWAYCVMRKMANEGSKMYREHRREDIFDTPIAEMTDELRKLVGVYYSDYIKRTLFRIDIAE